MKRKSGCFPRGARGLVRGAWSLARLRTTDVGLGHNKIGKEMGGKKKAGTRWMHLSKIIVTVDNSVDRYKYLC